MNRYGVSGNYLRKKAAFTSLGSRLHLAVPSQWLKDQVKLSFLGDTECTVIPNGIDLNQFYPMETSFKEDHAVADKKLITACSSIWTERKGLNQLAEISHHLPENCVLCVIGVTKKQSKYFSPQTICIERTDSIRTLAEIYSAGDLFVNPTLEETFSLVNIEAQACGCPAAAYSSGGCTETISEKSGVILPKNDTEGMLKVIWDISEGRRIFKREDCTENAARFSAERLYDGYMNLYRRVLKEGV